MSNSTPSLSAPNAEDEAPGLAKADGVAFVGPAADEEEEDDDEGTGGRFAWILK